MCNRKVLIKGDICMGQNCDFEGLAKDIYTVFDKHDAIPNFRLYELLEDNVEDSQSVKIQELVEAAIQKRNNK